MNKITLSISQESVLTRIYALSALRSTGIPETGTHTVPLLSRNESAALRCVIKDVFVTWISGVARWVDDFNADDDELMQITLLLSAPDTVSVTAFRHDIERMLAFRTMGIALSGDEAEEYESTARDINAGLTRALAGAWHGQVRPHWL